jgi:Ca2+-binding EF-hand superfamily protein
MPGLNSAEDDILLQRIEVKHAEPNRDRIKDTITSHVDQYEEELQICRSSWKEMNERYEAVKGDHHANALASKRMEILHTRDHQPEERSSGCLGALMESAKAMRGAAPVHHNLKVKGITTCCQYIECTAAFQIICIMAVLVNVVIEGASADHRVKQGFRRLHGLDTEEEWLLPDILFIAYFSVELTIKVIANHQDLLTGRCREWRWLAFDALLVFSAILEIIVETKPSFAFLRVIRVLRLLRLVRVVKSCSCLKSFRTMMFAVINSMLSLFWALFMICWIVFVFATLFADAVASYYDSADINSAQVQGNSADVELYYSSLYEICVSLWCAITGGNDYYTYAQPLRLLETDVWFILFLMYEGFCFMALMNVITGIFVYSAIYTRTEDEVVQHWREDLLSTSREVKRIFRDADTDQSGTLTYEELAKHLENPWVKAYFSGLELDPAEAPIIFSLIDRDHDGCLMIEEFVDGIMKLKGTARAVDLVAMLYDQAHFGDKFDKLCGLIEDNMRELKDSIAPGSTPMPRIFAPLQECLKEEPRSFTAHVH